MLQNTLKNNYSKGTISQTIESRWSHDKIPRKFLHGLKRDLFVLVDDQSHRGVLLPLSARGREHAYLLPEPQNHCEGMLAWCIFRWPCYWRTLSARTDLQDTPSKQRRRQDVKLLHTCRSDHALADGGWHRINVRVASPWKTNKTHRARLNYRYINWRIT